MIWIHCNLFLVEQICQSQYMCALNHKLGSLKLSVFEAWFESSIWLIQINNSFEIKDYRKAFMIRIKKVCYSNTKHFDVNHKSIWLELWSNKLWKNNCDSNNMISWLESYVPNYGSIKSCHFNIISPWFNWFYHLIKIIIVLFGSKQLIFWPILSLNFSTNTNNFCYSQKRFYQ